MIAYGLITLSFLGGALIAVLDPRVVNWMWFAPVVIAGIVGVVDVVASNDQAFIGAPGHVGRQRHIVCAVNLAILDGDKARVVDPDAV